MLGRPAQEGVRISRRELIRLAATAAALIIAMTAILGIDFTPRLDVKVGDLAPTDIRAARAATFTNNVLTQAARDAARAAVPSQYDYTSVSAIATAAQQLSRFAAGVRDQDEAGRPAGPHQHVPPEAPNRSAGGHPGTEARPLERRSDGGRPGPRCHRADGAS